MTNKELLVLKLIEECAEVQQRACKMMQFGEDESQSTAPNGLGGNSAPKGTNYERLQEEYIDLCSVGSLLGLRSPSSVEIVAKQRKIEKYAAYSVKCGKVEVHSAS